MTATTFTDLGNSQDTTSVTTLALTIGANVNVGDNVFVAVSNNANTGDTYTCADSVGNTYIRAGQVSVTARTGSALFTCQVTHAMTSGSTVITATFASGARTNNIMCAWIETTPGFTSPLETASDSPSDGAASVSYTGSTASCGSRTPTSNPDLGIVLLSQANGSINGAVTNYTKRYDLTVSIDQFQVFALTNLTTTNAALAPTMSMNVANPGVGYQAVFKYQGNPTTGHQLGLTGVGT